MKFEFEASKSESNKNKHGIDFDEARAIWDDPEYLEIPLKTEDEQRVLIIGRIGEEHWSGIITYREDRIRIISVRRSRSEEVVLYES
ncbi:BrnT family toxin [Gemmatimonadota bacterium]